MLQREAEDARQQAFVATQVVGAYGLGINEERAVKENLRLKEKVVELEARLKIRILDHEGAREEEQMKRVMVLEGQVEVLKKQLQLVNALSCSVHVRVNPVRATHSLFLIFWSG